MKRSGPFSEPPDSENWKVAVLIPFPKIDTEYDRAKVPPYNGNDPPPAPGSLKALLFPPLLNKAQNKGTQGVRARYGAELPPIISIVRYPGRPVILVPEYMLETNLASRWEGVGLPRASGKSPDFPGSSPNFPGSFSATSPVVLSLWNLTAIQGFPGSFQDFPGGSPDFPGGFPDFPGGQPLFLGSLTPSPDSEKLSLNMSQKMRTDFWPQAQNSLLRISVCNQVSRMEVPTNPVNLLRWFFCLVKGYLDFAKVIFKDPPRRPFKTSKERTHLRSYLLVSF